MKSLYAQRAILLAACAAAIAGSRADVPFSYYSSLNGLSGAQLKNAIHALVTEEVNTLSYGSGNNSTWWGFYVTDRYEGTDQVIDRYSNEKFYFGSRGQSVSGMNIEHSFAKSWWGGSTSPNSYRDLFNLMPSEQKINSSKSNYPMGKVVSGASGNGCTTIGNGDGGFKVWEPADKWKGDFARDYMYMATAYQNLTWSGQQALQLLQQGSYPTLKPWAYELYISWALDDDVDGIETSRNDNVQSIQGNRNPYVDMPNLMEYVWGDSTDTPLNVLTTRKGVKFYGTLDDDSKPVEVYASTFLGVTGDCTVEYDLRPEGMSREVWQNDPQYGWKASAATGSSKYGNLVCHPSDAILLTPVIDLSTYATASLKFEHACNFAADPQAVLSVGVRVEGKSDVEPLDISVWPSGSSWSFVESGKVNLGQYAGKRIRVAFRYTSTDSEASTWEIKNLSVTAQGRYSGIENIPANLQPEFDNSTCPVEHYSLDGRRVDPSTYRGIAIRRQGTAVTKVILR